jgi:hypothetical protein
VKDAHARQNCRDLNGTEPWACCNCDCTRKLEEKLAGTGSSFLESLHTAARSKEAPRLEGPLSPAEKHGAKR